jgi:hypothetical protein
MSALEAIENFASKLMEPSNVWQTGRRIDGNRCSRPAGYARGRGADLVSRRCGS